MTEHFHIMQGLTRPKIEATLKDGDGNIINLTGYTVAFYMKAWDDGAMKISGSAGTVVSAVNGQVEYEFTAVNTNEPGDYWAWFIATSGGDGFASPNPELVNVHVIPSA